MENTGSFFVIESTDGTSAKKQLNILAKKLEQAGYDLVTYIFPRIDQPSGYFADQYKKDVYGSNGSVGPYTGSLFFTLDHYHTANEIRLSLSEGKVVLATKFIGSVMAEQGSLFNNDDERRGYYIWLDNLEFIMLNVPRPNKNLILRAGGNDRHSQIYDDLCNLYPQDFQRIDTERSGQHLTNKQLTDMLWATIQPQLPVKEDEIEETPEVKPVANNGKDSRRHDLGEVSLLVKNLIITSGVVDYEFTDTKSSYFTPKTLTKEQKALYEETMGTFLSSYQLMVKKLKEQAENKQLAQDITNILPMSFQAKAIVYGSKSDIKQLAQYLYNTQIDEAQQLAIELHPTIASRSVSTAKSKNLLNEFSESYGQQEEKIRLNSHSPRNELDLLDVALYRHSHLSLDEVKREIGTKSYAGRVDLFSNFLVTQPSSILADAHYEFEVLDSIKSLSELVANTKGTEFVYQNYTPRYGYELSHEIEEAGLSDLYEKCFDASLELHSMLTENKGGSAQYACLQGHRVRASFTLNANQIRNLTSATGTDKFNLVAKLVEKQREVHPLITSSIDK